MHSAQEKALSDWYVQVVDESASEWSFAWFILSLSLRSDMKLYLLAVFVEHKVFHHAFSSGTLKTDTLISIGYITIL